MAIRHPHRAPTLPVILMPYSDTKRET